jgi:hypothetical protein
MPDRTLRIHVVDQHGLAYGSPVEVEVIHRTLASEPIRKVKHPTGAGVEVDGLDGPPKGDYRITVTAQNGKQYASQFVMISGAGGATVTVTLAKGEPCKQSPPLQLPGGVTIPLGPVFEKKGDWGAYTQANPLIPRTLEDMRAVARRLFRKQGTKTVETSGALRHLDECAESLFSHFLLGFKNPVFQANDAREAIGKAIAEAELVPVDDKESTHFKVYWYDQPPQWAAEFLADIDAVCDSIVNDFREPYLGTNPPSKIPLHIRDLQRIRGMTCVDSPEIHLNRRFLDLPFGDQPEPAGGDARKQRKALLVHELFHRIEYAYGFRRLELERPFQWYSEGLASWAEYHYGETITSDQKTLGFTRVSRAGLYGASYFAMPFWLDVAEDSNFGKPLLRTFLEEFERNGGKGKQALQKAMGPDFLCYYRQWASDLMQKSRPVRGPQRAQTAEAHHVPIYVQLGNSGDELARLAEYRGSARELAILQFSTLNLNSNWDQTPDQPRGDLLATVDGEKVLAIRNGVHDVLVTVVAPREGAVVVTNKSRESGRPRDIAPVPPPNAPHVLLNSPPYVISVDELGNVIIEKTRDDGEKATTVLGYSYNPGWNTNHSSLSWIGKLTRPASTGELVSIKGWPPTSPSAEITVKARWQNGQVVERNPVTRKILIEGKRIEIETTLTDADVELSLIQRSTPFDNAELADHDGGANSDCKGDDCDPIVGATMKDDPKLVNSRPGARLEVGQPWWPAPGWVLLPTTYSEPGLHGGETHTIRQVYCLEGDCA